MKRWIAPLALAALLLCGCPGPTPPPSGPQGVPSPGAGGGAGGSGSGGDGGNGAAAGGDGASNPNAPAWQVLPKVLMDDKDFYPTLKPLETWPDPISLRSLAQVPQAEQPQEVRVRNLRELVELIVAKELQPSDPKAALGLDAQGRVFMKLGGAKAVGSASLETRPKSSPFPIFAMTLALPAKGPHTIESLRERVAKVVAPGLVTEMQGEHTRLEASPRVQGAERTAGMAILARDGRFGMQFPYLYAFADDERLVVLLQEVPHLPSSSIPEGK